MHWIRIRLKFPPFEKEHGLQSAFVRDMLVSQEGIKVVCQCQTQLLMLQHPSCPKAIKSIQIRYRLCHPTVTIGTPTVGFFLTPWRWVDLQQKYIKLPTIYHLITFLSTSCFNFLGKKKHRRKPYGKQSGLVSSLFTTQVTYIARTTVAMFWPWSSMIATITRFLNGTQIMWQTCGLGSFSSKKGTSYKLGCPPGQDASRHQDYYMFSRESLWLLQGGRTTQLIN